MGKDNCRTRRETFKFWVWCDLYQRFDGRCGSTLVQVMTCCLPTPGHYVKQYWVRQSHEGYFTRDTSIVNFWGISLNFIQIFHGLGVKENLRAYTQRTWCIITQRIILALKYPNLKGQRVKLRGLISIDGYFSTYKYEWDFYTLKAYANMQSTMATLALTAKTIDKSLAKLIRTVSVGHDSLFTRKNCIYE